MKHLGYASRAGPAPVATRPAAAGAQRPEKASGRSELDAGDGATRFLVETFWFFLTNVAMENQFFLDMIGWKWFINVNNGYYLLIPLLN